jgi:MFS family permease
VRPGRGRPGRGRLGGEAERSQREAIAEAVEREGNAQAAAILARGRAEAEAMEKRAEAFARYGDAAVLEMLTTVLWSRQHHRGQGPKRPLQCSEAGRTTHGLREVPKARKAADAIDWNIRGTVRLPTVPVPVALAERPPRHAASASHPTPDPAEFDRCRAIHARAPIGSGGHVYLSGSRPAATAHETPAPANAPATVAAGEAVRRGRLAGVGANVLALGLVSMVTDVSSEMVAAVLPLYLVAGLNLSLLQFGLIDGLYQGATALFRLAGGHLADRWQRRKAVAGAGYALSAVCKLGLLAAGSSAPALGAVVAADRCGKGLRTAPRDALISLSGDPAHLGQAFGVHRSMDTAGALAGPLLAFALLRASGGAFDAVFVVSFCVALLGVLLLALFVRDRREPLGAGGAGAVTVRAALARLRAPDLWRVSACAGLLGLVTVSDAFVYLLLQRRLDVDPWWFPLFSLGTAAGFLLLATPVGWLADRRGRWPVFLAGHLALLAAYLLLLGPAAGTGLLVAVLVLHGAFYAATDGVLMAVTGPLLPASLRASGMAGVQTVQAVARLGSSVLFGAAWTAWGSTGALAAAGAGLAAATLAAAVLAPARRRPA